MMNATDSGPVLSIRRVIKARRERVFKAWTTPELVSQWWRGNPDFVSGKCEIDLRVNGSYSMCMHHKIKGTDHIAVGTFLEVVIPERLVYTFNWTNRPGINMRVQVEFIERGAETELILTQTGFVDEKDRDNHQGGWTNCINNFEVVCLEK